MNENKIAKTPFGKRWIFFVGAALGAVLIFLLATAGYALFEIYIPLDKNSVSSLELEIEKGKGVNEISAQLKEAGLIRSMFWFETYVWANKLGSDLKAGKYSLGKNLNVPEIAIILSGGKVVDNSVQITFPEGFTMAQMKERMMEKGIAAAAEFNEEIIDGYHVQYKFLIGPPEETSLEGFLFPDTYRFEKSVKKDAIIKRMLDNFDDRLTPDLRQEISRQGNTVFETIILASIIQQEAASEEEMPQIGGVFANRLKNGMPLESDATINYITGKKMRQATIDDTRIVSPYNTYLNKGLPPGPICNPGLAAIKAAIFPEATDNLFFFHPLNKSAIFSKTLEEHNKNRQKYLD